MRKISWLVAGISLTLIVALMGCGHAKKDVIEAQLADQKADSDKGIQLAQDAASAADKKADAALATARTEIGAAKAEAIAAAEQKDADNMVTGKSLIEAGDAAVKRSAEAAAAKALSDANANAMAEDEKVKQAAKAAAGKALSAAEEADRKAKAAAREAEVAKTLPEPPVPTVFSVYFNLGQTKIKKGGLGELDKAAAYIKANPGATVTVEGHTDNIPVIRSAYKNNWELSQARAKVVTKHLVDKLGVSANAISDTIGVAFYKPVASNTGKDKVKNRRVDIVIVK
jgi:flagellar motor protein MotB